MSPEDAAARWDAAAIRVESVISKVDAAASRLMEAIDAFNAAADALDCDDGAPMQLKSLGTITATLTGVRRMEYSAVGDEFDNA